MGTANLTVYELTPSGNNFYTFFKVEFDVEDTSKLKDLVKVFIHELRGCVAFDPLFMDRPFNVEVDGNVLWIEATFPYNLKEWSEWGAVRALENIVSEALYNAVLKVKFPCHTSALGVDL